MKSLFVGSISSFSGKHLLTLGLARYFMNKGLSVGYFKPLGIVANENEKIISDEDAVFYAKVLSLKDKPTDICPVVLTKKTVEGALKKPIPKIREKINTSFKHVSKGKDLMLIGGIGNLSNGSFLGVSELSLIEDFSAKVLFVDKFESNLYENLDGFLGSKERLKQKMIGGVLNFVPKDRADYVKKVMKPFLKKKGVDLVGIIPREPSLGAVTVREIADAVNGRVICCENALENMVENISVGAMNVESALTFFRRVNNKVVITGGDRSEIQLAALETSTKAMVLTGELHPHHNIVERASELGVPIIVASTDTFATVNKIEELMSHLSLHEEVKVGKACDTIKKHLDLKLLKKKLGV